MEMLKRNYRKMPTDVNEKILDKDDCVSKSGEVIGNGDHFP